MELFEEYFSPTMDDILDKINNQGMDSLNAKELEILRTGVVPKTEVPRYTGYDDEDDEEDVRFSTDNLSDMAESEEEDFIDEVGPDWLERRRKARELYKFSLNSIEDIEKHYRKILNYLKDDKNIIIFKVKIIDLFLNKLGKIEIDTDKIDDKEMMKHLTIFKMSDHLLKLKAEILSKFGKDDD